MFPFEDTQIDEKDYIAFVRLLCGTETEVLILANCCSSIMLIMLKTDAHATLLK